MELLSLLLEEPLRRMQGHYLAELGLTGKLMEHLSRYLDRRLETAQQSFEFVRELPIIAFVSGAVVFSIEDSQWHTLPARRPLRSQGVLRDAVDESLRVTRFVSAVSDAVDAIRQSMERFYVPTQALFRSEERAAGDLWGIAALFSRTLMTRLPTLFTLKRQLFPDAGAKPKDTDQPAAERAPGDGDQPPGADWGLSLALLIGPITAALPAIAAGLELIIDSLPALGQRMIKPLLNKVDMLVRNLCGDIQYKVFSHLNELATVGIDFFQMLSGHLYFVADLYLRIISEYLQGSITVVTALLKHVFSLVDAICQGFWFVNQVTTFLAKLYPDYFSTTLVSPFFAIKELKTWLAKRLASLIDKTLSFGPSTTAESMLLLLKALNQLNIPEDIPNAPPLMLPNVRFPDLYASFFGPSGVELLRLRQAIQKRDATAKLAPQRQPPGSLATGALLPSWFTPAVASSVGLADAQVAGERHRLDQKLKAMTHNQVAATYAAWLQDRGHLGAFQVMAAALPLYLEELVRRKDLQSTTAEPPPPARLHATSPHILNRRMQLGTVKLPRLTLRVNEASLDPALAEELVQRIRTELPAAFQRGQHLFSQILPPGAEPQPAAAGS